MPLLRRRRSDPPARKHRTVRRTIGTWMTNDRLYAAAAVIRDLTMLVAILHGDGGPS